MEKKYMEKHKNHEKNTKFMKKHKIHEKTQNSWKRQQIHEKTTFPRNAATALGPSSKDRARCEVSDGIKDLSVRPLSVEL